MISSIRKPVAALTISAALTLGVLQHEGFRDVAYIPVKGDVPTIGAGSTRHLDGTPVKMGDTITRQMAVEYLKHDLDSFKLNIQKCIKVPLYEYEFEAYLSLTYNIGSTAFCNSTLVKKLNQQDYSGACQQILKWDKFKGEPLKGLTKRRQLEYKQCLGS